MTTFGLTANGFVVKQQQDIISEIQQALQSAFGSNINTLDESVFGQLMNIFSEREALIWQLIEAVYNSQYPTGAEGTSVDNILALNNLTRLAATATKTAPTSTAGKPGLILLGTPGTLIPAGSIISVQGNPSLQFTLDADVTIEAAANAIQKISFFGGVASSGSFVLQIVDPAGNTLTTPSIPWNALANNTTISFSNTPTGGQFVIAMTNALGTFLTTPLTNSASAATVQAAVQTALNTITGFASITVSGSYASGFTINWGTVSAPIVACNSTQLSFSANPTAGSLQISLNGTNAAAVAYNASAAQLQAAINAVSGFESVTVTGAANNTTGFYINWGLTTPATVLVVTQPTGATVSVVQTNTLTHSGAITITPVQSVQAYINTLFDAIAANYPYTDVSVTLSSGSFVCTFGGLTALSGQLSSGNQAQEPFTVPANSLQQGGNIVNVAIINQQTGQPAEGIGSATCTATGPNSVPAGYLNVIGSPVSGWASVTNPLDCIPGTNRETDTAALTRRATLLASQANGPLEAIVEKVRQVTGVMSAIGFENVSMAADQIITFSSVPTAGFFIISLIGPDGNAQVTAHIPYNAQANVQTLGFSAVPASGSFQLQFGTMTTALIAWNATASAIQSAIQALTPDSGITFPYANAVVTGSFSQGFNFSFGIAQQFPITVTNNTLLDGGLAAVTTTPVGSVQAYVNNLSSYGPAQISGSLGVGLTLSFNGSAGGQPQQIATVSNFLTGTASITVAFGRPGKSFEIVVNDNNGEASNLSIANAIFGSKPAGIQSFGALSQVVEDVFGNSYPIYFSRPTQVPFYVTIALVTDLTTNPNPEFSVSSIATIQEQIAAIGNAVPIGGLVKGFGTGGLIGAFNNIPGILSYTLAFGTSANPTQNTNVQLGAEQVPLFETFNCLVSYQ